VILGFAVNVFGELNWLVWLAKYAHAVTTNFGGEEVNLHPDAVENA